MTAELTPFNPFDFFVDQEAAQFPFRYSERLQRALQPCLEITEESPAMRAWVADADHRSRPTIDFIVSENQRLREAVAYELRHEPGVLSCDEVLERGVGSCRDSSWLLIQTLRRHGIAARFVSGYQIHLITAGEENAGDRARFSELHAWVEAYIPGAGWIGLDPTSGLLATEEHIPLACAPEPADTAPVEGSTGLCEVDFHYHNRIISVEKI